LYVLLELSALSMGACYPRIFSALGDPFDFALQKLIEELLGRE
jgi:hypothetical protein